MTRSHTHVDSLLGELTLVAEDGALVGLYFPHHQCKPDPTTLGVRTKVGFEDAERQLDEYFEDRRQEFDLHIAPSGDDFQHRVWDVIRRIPYGQTSTYGRLARELGNGISTRQVDTAVRGNPLCVLVPCHRVVGPNGRPTGYAGNLSRKQLLLDLEGGAFRDPIHNNPAPRSSLEITIEGLRRRRCHYAVARLTRPPSATSSIAGCCEALSSRTSTRRP